jgi:hypothetical protein
MFKALKTMRGIVNLLRALQKSVEPLLQAGALMLLLYAPTRVASVCIKHFLVHCSIDL